MHAAFQIQAFMVEGTIGPLLESMSTRLGSSRVTHTRCWETTKLLQSLPNTGLLFKANLKKTHLSATIHDLREIAVTQRFPGSGFHPDATLPIKLSRALLKKLIPICQQLSTDCADSGTSWSLYQIWIRGVLMLINANWRVLGCTDFRHFPTADALDRGCFGGGWFDSIGTHRKSTVLLQARSVVCLVV